MAQLDWVLTVQSLVKLGVTVNVCKKMKKQVGQLMVTSFSWGRGGDGIVGVLGDFVTVNTSSNCYDAQWSKYWSFRYRMPLFPCICCIKIFQVQRRKLDAF